MMFQDFISWINRFFFLLSKIGYSAPNNPLLPLKEW